MGRGGRRRRGAKRAREEPVEENRPSSFVDVSLWMGDNVTDSVTKCATNDIPGPLSADYFEDANKSAVSPLSVAYSSLLRMFWKALKAKKTNWSEPSPIQCISWPVLLSLHTDDRNLIQLAPTGSGKTLAYGIPLLIQGLCVDDDHQRSRTNSLIIVPTRELAQQVTNELSRTLKVAKSDGLQPSVSIVALYGGVSKNAQVKELQEILKVEKVRVILVATPGRLMDLVDSNTNESNKASPPENDVEEEEEHSSLIVNTPRLHKLLSETMCTVVLDEADRLASNKDLSLQVEKLLGICSSRRRLCLCTATWPERVLPIWTKWLESPCNPAPCILVKVDTMNVGDQNSKRSKPHISSQDYRSEKDFEEKQRVPASVEFNKDVLSQIPAHLTQTLHVCAEHKKPRKLLSALQKILKEDSSSRSRRLGIVFFARIKTLKYVSSFLTKEGISSCELHSHMKQIARDQTVQNFKCGKTRLMLATDIAARGLHIQNVSYVINYDFPGNLEQYIHRCGRAGRGVGASAGEIFSFFTRNLAPMASDVIQLLEASKQWVDPNLLELLKHNEHSVSMTRRKASQTTRLAVDMEKPSESQDDDSDVPMANRIVLRRASNISDPSSASDDSDSD